MEQGEHKSRVGDWRIFYEVDEASRTIDILAVRPRQQAYKKRR
jgi:mRNA-degrading endonuclease RelE of RelBE toxin-antitoxin system